MTAQQICDLLNDASDLDPEGVRNMFLHAFPVTDELSNHPTIPCFGSEECPDGIAKLRILGLLNGIAAIDGELIMMREDFSQPFPCVEFHVVDRAMRSNAE